MVRGDWTSGSLTLIEFDLYGAVAVRIVKAESCPRMLCLNARARFNTRRA